MRSGLVILLLLSQSWLSTASLPNPFAKWRRGEQTNDSEAPLVDVQDLSIAARHGHIHFVSGERIVNKVFNDADTNHDGAVNFSEVYELVLKIYITINQQAPIPPPSKKRVLQLFLNADTSHNNRLNREEFRGLANILARRAISRIIAHKLVTLVGAPLLAAYLMRALTGTEWLPKLAKTLVPERYEEKLLPIITSPTFCRTVLIIILVSTLGNIVMQSVNWILDLSLQDEQEDQRLKEHEEV